MQFEIDFFLILVGTWPRSLFRQQEEQSEHTYIREVMQAFLTCTHNRLSKDYLNMQTLPANFLTTSIFYTESPNRSIQARKTNHKPKCQQNVLLVNLES